MEDPDVPTRSVEGLSALAIFYDDFNDVHFFVEDQDQENLYDVVLRRMFPELRIARIFPLGGKQAVVEHAKEVMVGPRAHRSVHLVDKDFDDLLGTLIQQPTLFYLERYCIENYFAEPDAIIEVIIESQPRFNRAEVSAELDLGTAIPKLMESIRPLYQLFFCVQRFGLGIKNCALPVERFCSQKRRWVVDPVLLDSYLVEVVAAASQGQHASALADPLSHPEIAPLSTLDVHTVVSGKHLCALVFHYLKSKYNLGTITFESFLFRLAKNASLRPLQGLAARVRKAIATPAPAVQ